MDLREHKEPLKLPQLNHENAFTNLEPSAAGYNWLTKIFFAEKNKLFQTTCQHVWLIIKTTMSTIISFSPLLKKNHFFLSSSERSVMYLCILSDAITHWVFFSKFHSNWLNHCFSTCQNLHFGLQISSMPLYFEYRVFPYSFRSTNSVYWAKKLKFAATIWIFYNFQTQKRSVSAETRWGNTVFVI